MGDRLRLKGFGCTVKTRKFKSSGNVILSLSLAATLRLLCREVTRKTEERGGERNLGGRVKPTRSPPPRADAVGGAWARPAAHLALQVESIGTTP